MNISELDIFVEWRLDQRVRPTPPPVGTYLLNNYLRQGA
jgi:hypothetical protein